ncbi:MAG: 2Fe-2S iron-sulfur cluster binding domain-containing protein [Rhodoferax sp.]|nr:2Fe-2S iron-sulfur cluster binding domain-containing protein [Rhodoferax sp.]MCF8209877.1 2Fe-2S iron-sulfur cluster binding domain-containing protein [Rhodoferax sp.]
MNDSEHGNGTAQTGARYAFCVVNGDLQKQAPGSETLLDWLRDAIQCKDVPRPCETGHCGACVAIVGGTSVKSCSMLAREVEGKEIFTLNGLELSGRKPVAALQQALKSVKPFQCGYCQPAFVVAAIELLEANVAPTESEIRDSFAGLLCRCTGYQMIVDAVLLAAKMLTEERMAGL